MLFVTGAIAAPSGANCNSCGLADCPYVPGYGNDSPYLVIVGEAPGDSEVKHGKPFVGKSGQLLNEVLDKSDIKRDDCYVTNACLCRPTPHRPPTAAEIRCCRPRLIKEIKEKSPQVILALGNSALRAIVGSSRQEVNISKMRGAPFWSDEFNAWVVPSYHPAAILRKGNLYTDLVKDVQSVAGLFKSKIKVYGPEDVEYKLVRTYEDVCDLVGEMPKEIAVDTEWSSDDRLLCIGVSWGRTAVVTKEALADPRTREMLDRAFSQTKLIGQNFKSDLQRLWKYGISSARVGWDTMLAHYTLDERHGHDLGKLAREYLQWSNYKDEVSEYKSHMENCPEDLMYRYNARDTAATWMLVPKLVREMGPDEWRVLNNLLLPAANVVADMEMRGIMIDRPYLLKLQDDLTQKIFELKNELNILAGKEFNPNSVRQLTDIMYKHLNLPLTSNGFSTDKETLELLSKYHPLPAKMLEYRKAYKFLSTYVNSLLEAADENDRVHTNFNLHGTSTGRLSSSDPVNLQNITRGDEARNMFMATPGYTLVECDMCLAGDTLIETPYGAMPIKDIHPGDLVYSYHNRKVTVGHVTKQWCIGVQDVIKVTLDNGESIICTPDHKFLVLERSNRPEAIREVIANDLTSGTRLLPFRRTNTQGYKVISVERLNVQLPVYSITVEPYHNYALKAGIFVKNSQSEVRVLAWYSQDKNLIAALNSDVDIHTANAATMFGVKPEDVTKDMRQASKHLTFGVIYQMSAQSLAEELKISLPEAEDLIHRFFNTFKQAREWIEATKEAVLKHSKLTTAFGRTRRFPLITKENRAEALREAVNFPIQSVSSDITLTGLIKAGYQLGGNQDTRLLLTVHDSIMLETTHDPLEVGKWLAELMTTDVLDGSVPFKADIKYGPKWGTMLEVEL